MSSRGSGGPWGAKKSIYSLVAVIFGDFWGTFWAHFGDFLGPKSMPKSMSFSDVEKVALGTEQIDFLSLGGPENP